MAIAVRLVGRCRSIVHDYVSHEEILLPFDFFFQRSQLLSFLRQHFTRIFTSYENMDRSIYLCVLISTLAVAYGSTCPSRESIAQSLQKVNVPGAAIIVVNATHTLYE